VGVTLHILDVTLTEDVAESALEDSND